MGAYEHQRAETIAAIATPPGVGGIAVLRVSGPRAGPIAASILGRVPEPRRAVLREFLDAQGELVDRGIAIFAPAPGSFTGEDVLELQGHGGPVVMDLLLRAALEAGARMARPGEFSERAFLNGKLDLAQAEAVADLIAAGSEAAARAALRSLEGALSQAVTALADQLTELRVHVEAAIDFPEEEVDHLSEGPLAERMAGVHRAMTQLLIDTNQGRLLTEGLKVVIAGRPNVGKSSLLNALAGSEAAIVTDQPGTTRDVLRESIVVHGIPLHLADTAGLRDGGDPIEREGMRRTQRELEQADVALYVTDRWPLTDDDAAVRAALPSRLPPITVRSKCDLAPEDEYMGDEVEAVAVSALTGAGLDALRDTISRVAGQHSEGGSTLSARRRHVDALERCSRHVAAAEVQLKDRQGELMAEELRQAQRVLGEITGEVTPDDLLGRIFASFCIGK